MLSAHKNYAPSRWPCGTALRSRNLCALRCQDCCASALQGDEQGAHRARSHDVHSQLVAQRLQVSSVVCSELLAVAGQAHDCSYAAQARCWTHVHIVRYHAPRC